MRFIFAILIVMISFGSILADVPFQTKGDPEKIIGDVENQYMHPVWSPDGSKIAFTGINYTGLWIMNPDGSNPIQITDEIAAGWAFEWSADSKSILTRVAKYEGPRRYNAVKIFDVADGKSTQLTDYKTFMPGLPHWANSDQQIIIFNKKKLETFQSQKNVSAYTPEMTKKKVCFLRYARIAVMDNDTKEISFLDPFKDYEYLNPVISPDNQQIAFEVYGGNLHVMNIDGTNLRDLGIGNAPQWSPDSKHVVYMLTTDDGYQFTSSDIYIVNVENIDKINLTNTTEELEMNPSWSPDGTKIAYDVANTGMIYIVELTK